MPPWLNAAASTSSLLQNPAKGKIPARATAAHDKGDAGGADVFEQPAHLPHVLLTTQRVHHRASAEEQQAVTEKGATIGVAQAVQIAKQAVTDGALLRQIDGVNVKQDVQNGQPVWVVTLSGDGKAATVTIDAHSGEVLGLDVQ